MKRNLHIVAVAALAGSLAAGAVQTLFSAFAVQNEMIPPTSGVYTGPQFSQLLGNAFRSLASGNKGPTAPANVGGSAVDLLPWVDDSSTPWIKKRYVNGGWAVEGAYDPVNSSYIGVIGGGLATLASGSTVDLGSVPQANVTITGTATISSFGGSAPTGISKIIRFADAVSITHSSSLTVPGGFPLTTAANDRAIVTNLGSGNWEITQFTRASGVPVDVTAVGKPDFSFQASVPPLHVRGDGRALARATYPAYLAKATRAQNGTRTSGNATITGVADTSGMGAGMPVESTGVGAGCTIASVVANSSITLNSSGCVTSSGTSTVTVFLTGYGTGGSSSTVGVPDCRGRALAGRDHNDPGSLANRLTSGYFGADSGVFGATGGLENFPMALANLIAHSHSGTTSGDSPDHSHGYNVGVVAANQTGGGSFAQVASNAASNTGGASARHTHTFQTDGGTGGGASPTPMRTVQPTLIAECVVRVIP